MVRLNKFLAERIGVSRREADNLIASGKIIVNGQPAQIGAQVDQNSTVSYRGKTIPFDTDHAYIMLNKPVGYVSSRKRQGDVPTLYELIPDEYQHLKTVGRLDKNSSGLILLTNDGDFAYQMTHPKFVKVKIYEVELDQPLQPLHQQMIADFGVDLPDGKSQLGLEEIEIKPAEPDASAGNPPARRTRWRVTMHEGRNRQIRRTFDALGYTVVKLHRTNFGPYNLNGLRSGRVQPFRPRS